MNQRGEYGPDRGYWSRALVGTVGAVPFQAGDAERAIEQLDSEMEAIINATYRSMGVDPTALRRPASPDAAWMQRVRDAKAKAMQIPLWAFWETTVSPKYDDWKASREAFRTKPPTSWDDYGLWHARIGKLRADVKAKGIKLETPELTDLSMVSASATPSIDHNKLLKWGAIGALAIGGVAVLVAFSSATKTARAPYERYRYGYRSEV